MSRSSRKTKPLSSTTASEGKRVSIRTDKPQSTLDPESAVSIELELQQLNLLDTNPAVPEEITWDAWTKDNKITPKYYIVANLAIAGMKPGEIAKETGISPLELSIILGNPIIQAYRSRVVAYTKQDSKKRFQALVPKAVGIYEDVLSDFSQESTKNKIDVATKVMDRQWGKPQGDIADPGGTVLNLLRELKEINHSAHKDPYERALEVKNAINSPNSEDIEDAEETLDSGSVSDLLNTWEESDNESNEQNEEESGDENASEEKN